jgi:hypothetical protein
MMLLLGSITRCPRTSSNMLWRLLLKQWLMKLLVIML